MLVAEQLLEVRATDLLLAFDEHLEVDGQATVACEQPPHRLELVEHLALVVDGAAGEALTVDDDGLEGRVVPLVLGVDRLNVVVSVDEHRRSVGVPPRATRRRPPGDRPSRAARRRQTRCAGPLGQPLGRPPHLGRTGRVRGDRRDGQPAQQRVDDVSALPFDEPVEALPFGHARHATARPGRGRPPVSGCGCDPCPVPPLDGIMRT